MIRMTIDNREVMVQEGTTILEAAREAGIYIPTLCYHPDLTVFAGCRVCMVEADGKLVTSCNTEVAEGMNVLTDTPEVSELRRVLVEMILASHHPDCQSCAANNDCVLQEVTAYVGIDEDRLELLGRDYSKVPPDTSNAFFNVDHSRCILCGICVRTCNEINGVAAIDFTFRGTNTMIAPLGAMPMAESQCESCGECVERCPTGALTRKSREIPSREVKSICTYCGVGCGIILGTKGDRVVKVTGNRESPVNRGHLCVKGRFGFEFIDHPDRLKMPLVKKDGEFKEVSWDEALEVIVDKLKSIREKNGADAISGLSSARSSNEANYLFQKMLRSLGTNNVDHCARV
mgnify:CR=1 FL=1|jgi:formate dehydrogenase major subunit